jgi:alpha-galactosidase
MGVVPGLWFEFEVVGKQSRLWARTDLLLHRDGVPLEVGDRRFLDMRKTECHEYLEKNVLDLIDRCGIGYVKVDYNETLGIGVDGAESLGEGLRQHVEGVYRFFRSIKQRFPNLVIENCSSGGQRMEPSMIMLSAMTSFSDAHETTSIPIIAANVQRVILPRFSQVWCVLRKDDDERRLTYGLAATLLGRMCLSGDLLDLTDQQTRIVRKAVDFYGDASDIIRRGTSLRYGPPVNSYNDPEGWQAVCRYGKKGERILVVIHRFKDDASKISIPLQKAKSFVVRNVFSGSRTRVTLNNHALEIDELDSFAGCGVLLEK